MDRTGVVGVGHYSLEVGSSDGAFALFRPEPEQDNAAELADALSEPAEQEQPAATGDQLEGLLEDASAVTSRCEKSLRLFNAIAQGRALDPKVVSDEVDALVTLVGRLDRAGHREEALRVARDLSALLALLLRWLDLVRSLRLALRTARSLGDLPGEAWALHELGSLHLVAGDPAGASTHLAEAVRIKSQLGSGHGRCASRHNLDAASRDLAEDARDARARRSRRIPLLATVFALALLTGGGTALGLALTDPGSTPVPPPATTASATTSATTSRTTSAPSTTTATYSTTTQQPTTTTPPTTTDTTTTTPPSTTTDSTTTPPPTKTKPPPTTTKPPPTTTGPILR